MQTQKEETEKTVQDDAQTEFEIDHPELAKAYSENRFYCPKDGTAIRYKEGVNAFVCARGHLLYIDIQPQDLRRS